ncbi:septum formation family protein [Streptomyces sp. NPDC008137]|uniref:DUF4190 domain-containing protein n=1 Tax=Streptomyces sp. NPDC008137 TaxID=3364813 RepID=UPI0036E5E7F0
MSTPPPPGHPQPQDPYGRPPANWPQAHRPYGTPVSVNALAVAALVLGVLCFLPAAGLVLGLVALWQIRRSGQSGRGMAIAGVALSAVGAVLWGVVLATGVASDVWAKFEDGARGNQSLSLRTGDCFDAPDGLEGDTYDVDPVSCEGGHDGEVFGVVTLPGGAFPGDGEVTDIADERCYPLESQYAMDTWAMPADVDVYYLMPSRETWRYGDRAIICVFGSTDAKAELTGSLREDPTTLDTDQVVFLSTANAVDAALYEEPEEPPESDLAGARAWAAQVRDVLGEQTRALRGHSWPSAAREPVADLAEEMADAGEEWSKASEAGDVDTWFTHYEKAYAYVDGPEAVTARKALGLDTTPRSFDDSDKGNSEIEV